MILSTLISPIQKLLSTLPKLMRGFTKASILILCIHILTIEMNAQETGNVSSSETLTSSSWVILKGDSLFPVYTTMGSFSKKERAEAIQRRIISLMEGGKANLDSIHLHEDNEGNFQILHGRDRLMMVTRSDAKLARTETFQLGELCRDKIKEALEKELEGFSILEIMLEMALSSIIILVLLFLYKGINKLAQRAYHLIEEQKGKRFKGWKIKKVEILNEEREVQILIMGVKVVRIAVLLVLIAFALPILFKIFPWTKGIADAILGFILTPIKSLVFGFVGYLPNLFFISVAVFIARYLVKGMKFIANEMDKGNIEFAGFHQEWVGPTFNILRIVVYAFSLVFIFPYLPFSDSGAFKGVSIFLGVLFSLGSSSAISNLVAGLVITYMTPFKIGDRIKIGDNVGDVMSRTMLVIRMRTLKNEEITIPNALVLSSHIVNYSGMEQNLILYTSVTIGYDVPWTKVHELLIAAGKNTKRVVSEPEPFVLQKSLQNNAVHYELNCYTDQPGEFEYTYSDLHQNIQDEFNKAGVEILTPVYSAIRDGNQSTIPSVNEKGDGSYLKQSGSFRVSLIDRILGGK